MAGHPTTKQNGSDRHRDLVVIGCSAGCIEGLCSKVLPSLPGDFPAAVCVVMHMSPQSPRVLDHIWGRHSEMPVKYAQNGAELSPGHVYIAPPDYHLLVEDATLALDRGPRENLHRPAADPLFCSAAEAYGERVVGVVLTGNLDDGTRGLAAIKSRGGVAVVQDPQEALYPGMPESALRRVGADYCVAMAELAPLLVRLTQEKLPAPACAVETGESGGFVNDRDSAGLTCPECGGPLQEKRDNGLSLFRCRVGHRYSLQSMTEAQSESVESALWGAVQLLRQQADIRQRLAKDADARGHEELAQHYRRKSRSAEEQADIVQGFVENDLPLVQQ